MVRIHIVSRRTYKMLTLFPAGELDWEFWKGGEDFHISFSVALNNFCYNCVFFIVIKY